MIFNEDYYMHGVEKGISNYENYRWIPDLTIPMARFLKKFMKINSGESLLDLGCARGYVVKALRMFGVAAYGYDISEWAISNCDPSVTKYVNSFGPLEQSDTYNYLFCKDVLEHIPACDLEKTLGLIFPKIEKDALIIVPLAIDGQYVSPDDEKDTTHIHRWGLQEWVNLIQSCTNKYSILISTNIPILKLGARRHPGSTGFLYCIRHTDEDDITIRYDQFMDRECVNLCDVLNSLPGIKTCSSCCGHDKDPFRVYFNVNTIEALSPVLQILDARRTWTISTYWASGSNNIYFCLEGPIDTIVGDELAVEIADYIKRYKDETSPHS